MSKKENIAKIKALVEIEELTRESIGPDDVTAADLVRELGISHIAVHRCMAPLIQRGLYRKLKKFNTETRGLRVVYQEVNNEQAEN